MSSKQKVVAGFITVTILTILILSGPAQGYILGLSILHPEAYKGEIINFVVSASSEVQDTGVNYFILDLIGTPKPNVNYTCKFDVNGTIITGCTGMTITQIETEFGYGYGYGYGKLEKAKYNITLDTIGYISGKYKTIITSVQESKLDVKKGAVINIKPQRSGMKDCSIRGSGGNLSAEEINFGTRNKINFFIPLENAVGGKGYLTGQLGKNRISYNFDILDVVFNSENESKIFVSGKYRINLDKEVREEAVVILVKSGKISIEGNNIQLENMSITFKKGC